MEHLSSFFFEKPVKNFIQTTAKLLSINTRGSTSIGISSNQTCGASKFLANLANLSATALPFQRAWEKEEESSCEAKESESSITIPKEAWQDESA